MHWILKTWSEKKWRLSIIFILVIYGNYNVACIMLNRIIIEINFIFSARKFEIMVVVFIVFPSDSSEIDSSQRFSAFGENGE